MTQAACMPVQVLNWALRGKGALTTTGCDRGLFVKTNDKLSQPDLQIRYISALALTPNGVDAVSAFGRLKVRIPTCMHT